MRNEEYVTSLEREREWYLYDCILMLEERMAKRGRWACIHMYVQYVLFNVLELAVHPLQIDLLLFLRYTGLSSISVSWFFRLVLLTETTATHSKDGLQFSRHLLIHRASLLLSWHMLTVILNISELKWPYPQIKVYSSFSSLQQVIKCRTFSGISTFT